MASMAMAMGYFEPWYVYLWGDCRSNFNLIDFSVNRLPSLSRIDSPVTQAMDEFLNDDPKPRGEVFFWVMSVRNHASVCYYMCAKTTVRNMCISCKPRLEKMPNFTGIWTKLPSNMWHFHTCLEFVLNDEFPLAQVLHSYYNQIYNWTNTSWNCTAYILDGRALLVQL